MGVVLNLSHRFKLFKTAYFGAVLQLKLVEEGPSVSQVRFNLHRPQEPLSGFGDFALTPKQPKRECQDLDQRKFTYTNDLQSAEED